MLFRGWVQHVLRVRIQRADDMQLCINLSGGQAADAFDQNVVALVLPLGEEIAEGHDDGSANAYSRMFCGRRIAGQWRG